jgi:hypothetical protein
VVDRRSDRSAIWAILAIRSIGDPIDPGNPVDLAIRSIGDPGDPVDRRSWRSGRSV